MLWLFVATLTLIVLLTILWPFRHQHASTVEPAAAYDLQVYRNQLIEVEWDLKRNIIDRNDAERLRTEISRKILDADRILHRAKPIKMTPERHSQTAAIMLGGLIILGGGIYALTGSPNQPDMGLNSRIAAANIRYASRPDQAQAEAAYTKFSLEQPEVKADPELIKLVGELRSAVSRRPDDTEGLSLLARYEAKLQNTLAAKDAQKRLLALKGDQATSDDHAFLASLMAEATGGLITSEAEAEIARALRLNPSNPQARYMSGLLQAQNGRPDRTFTIWAGLLNDIPPSSPLYSAVRGTIEDLAWIAGQPDYVPPDDIPALPAPNADNVASAADMSLHERQEFIRTMVEQLESRLATEGGTADEWSRLISSLGVQGNTDHARTIYTEALERFADSPAALTKIQSAAEQAGISK